MREILHKGKRKNNGEWVEGYYVYRGEEYSTVDTNAHFIVAHDMCGLIWYEVIPESVSEFTGVPDKNGTKIFEGDIVRHFNNSDEGYDIGVIYFDTTFLGWRRTTEGRFHRIELGTYKLNPTCIYEVIGNIYDNPELLKGGDTECR